MRSECLETLGKRSRPTKFRSLAFGPSLVCATLGPDCYFTLTDCSSCCCTRAESFVSLKLLKVRVKLTLAPLQLCCVFYTSYQKNVVQTHILSEFQHFTENFIQSSPSVSSYLQAGSGLCLLFSETTTISTL